MLRSPNLVGSVGAKQARPIMFQLLLSLELSLERGDGRESIVSTAMTLVSLGCMLCADCVCTRQLPRPNQR